MIDGTPKVVFHAVDFPNDFVKMPASMLEIPLALDPAAADLRRENRPEAVPPKPNRLMGDVDASLVQQILDIPQRKRIADLHHHREADNFGAGLEVAEDAGITHAARLAALPANDKPIFLLQSLGQGSRVAKNRRPRHANKGRAVSPSGKPTFL
jgi:hypothetical protein